jgi:hypothetical protein
VAGAPAVEDEWAWPGRPDVAPPPPAPDGAARALTEAVDALLAQDVLELPAPVALERTRVLLRETDRLGLALGQALVDVQARELYADDAAGSVWSWLRRQPTGDGGRLARAQRLAVRPVVQAAVATGTVGLGAAGTVCRMLDKLPADAGPGQVEGVLRNGLPMLLSRWTAGDNAAGGDEVAAARAATVAQVIADGLAATAMSPADRLEPAFTLVAQAIAPGVLEKELQELVDALAPEPAADAAERAYQDRSLRVRKKRCAPGWRLTGELTDEVGEALHADLEARQLAHQQDQARLATARQAAGADGDQPARGAGGDADALFGTVGAGSAPHLHPDSDTDPWGEQPDSPRPLTDEQLAHDLFAAMLADLGSIERPGAPRPRQITITADLAAAEGTLGALPGTLLTPNGPTTLTREQLRRAGCDGILAAVLLDAARTPVGASGTHRHATERERRALRAMWGSYCSEDGCPSTRTVPHHVNPWWKTGITKLADLVQFCDNTHHAVHDGHKTIRLRDGRLLDENGWVDRPPNPFPEQPPPR